MEAVCEAVLERRLKRPFIERSDSARDNRPVHLRSQPSLSTLAVVLAVLASPLALADSEQDRARAAVQAGKVLPLKAVLERLEREHPGQVLEVELEQDDGRWIYEIKLLQSGGRLVKLELDAASGAVLQRKERARKPDARP
jgi:Peptidase propeptide and YPEB domain